MQEQERAETAKARLIRWLRSPETWVWMAIGWGVFLASYTALWGGVAHAQAMLNPFENVSQFICTTVSYLQGPIGMGLVVAALAAGGISMAIGSRHAVPLLVGGLIGAAIILGARALLQMVGGTLVGC